MHSASGVQWPQEPELQTQGPSEANVLESSSGLLGHLVSSGWQLPLGASSQKFSGLSFGSKGVSWREAGTPFVEGS